MGCCWGIAKSPGGTADRGHHLVGGPVRRPGPQEGVIAGGACCSAATAQGPLLASDGTELESLVGQGFTL